MIGKSLNLTTIGRFIINKVNEKYNIKRIDRLLGNQYLHKTRNCFYMLFVQKILSSISSAVIIIDWSVIRAKQFYLLRATITFQGRSIIICEKFILGKNLIQLKHTNISANILPKDFKPIVVTDAGFKGPWFKLIENMGWNYIARIRGKTLYFSKKNNNWIYCLELHQNKNIKALYLYIENTYLARTNPYKTHLYYCRQKNRTYPRKSIYYSTKNIEPWILASSIKCSPKKIMFMYKSRMQIDESFRNTKSRIGFNLQTSRTYDAKRFDILLLIASLATIIIGLIGMENNIQFKFQVNTIKNKTVLSIFFLGLRLFIKNSIPIQDLDVIYAMNYIRGTIINGYICIHIRKIMPPYNEKMKGFLSV